MTPEINKKYLITTDNWFLAPDGNSYRAVFGTVIGIQTDENTLGVKTNRSSTNWYVAIGNMLIAGCQIHYVIQVDEVSFNAPNREIEHDGKLTKERESITRIYNADET
jgi:hypothetical protein